MIKQENSTCAVDIDCGKNLVCFNTSLSWNKDGYSYCDCPDWFGWYLNENKDFCDQFGTTAYFSVALNGLLCIGYLYLIFGIIMRDILMLKQKKKLRSNQIVLCFFLEFLDCCFGLTLGCILITMYATPYQELILNDGDKDSIYLDPIQVLLTLIFLASNTAQFLLALTWYGFAVKTEKLRTSLSKRERVLRKVIFGLEAFFTLIAITLIATSTFEYISFVTLPFHMLVIIALLVGFYKFEQAHIPQENSQRRSQLQSEIGCNQIWRAIANFFKLMKTTEVSGGRALGIRLSPRGTSLVYQDSTELVRLSRKTILYVMYSLLFQITSNFWFVGLTAVGWKEYPSSKTGMSLPALALDFVIIAFFLNSAVIIRYLHRTTRMKSEVKKNIENGNFSKHTRPQSSGNSRAPRQLSQSEHPHSDPAPKAPFSLDESIHNANTADPYPESFSTRADTLHKGSSKAMLQMNSEDHVSMADLMGRNQSARRSDASISKDDFLALSNQEKDGKESENNRGYGSSIALV